MNKSTEKIGITEIVNAEMNKGNTIKLIFKDGSSFYLSSGDNFSLLGTEFVLVEAELINTGKRVKTIRNVREIRSADIK